MLADDFASNGYKTIIPDYLNNDPVPADALGPGSDYDVIAWFTKHTQEATRPPLDKLIGALKAAGVTKFGATGYCFGGRYVFDLAFDNVIHAAVANHPTFIAAPEDLERYKASSKAPLLINSCEVDKQFPATHQAKADEILGGGKFAPGYRREYFPGCTHGFAVRGDISIPEVKAGKEGAFKAAIAWFNTHLKRDSEIETQSRL